MGHDPRAREVLALAILRRRGRQQHNPEDHAAAGVGGERRGERGHFLFHDHKPEVVFNYFLTV